MAGKQEHVYLVLNKPLGYVTTVRDPHAQHTVMELVKGVAERIYPVGRLDADSAGLLLMSNDGEFTQRLTHPSHQVPKTYRAVVRGEVSEWAAADLRRGIVLEDGMSAPGMQIGPIKLKGIAPGTWRRLHPSEVKALLQSADIAPADLPQVPEEDEPAMPERKERRTLSPGPVRARAARTSNIDPAILDAARALTQQLKERPDPGTDKGPSSRAARSHPSAARRPATKPKGR